MTLPINIQDVMNYADNLELVLGIAPIPGVDKFIMPKAQTMLGEPDRWASERGQKRHSLGLTRSKYNEVYAASSCI